MAPKPIQACGRVREEPRIETGERDTIATRLFIEGISNTPEYIAFVEQQVASGRFTDAVADEIRARVAEAAPQRRRYTYNEFATAVLEAARETSLDEGFRSSFEFQKKNHDSLMDSAEAARRKVEGRERVPLSPREEAEVQTVIKQIGRDNAESTDMVMIAEVDRALTVIRRKIIENLGIDIRKVDGPIDKLTGIQPMDIEDDGGDEDGSPSDFHMDMGALGESLDKASLEEIDELTPDDKEPKP